VVSCFQRCMVVSVTLPETRGKQIEWPSFSKGPNSVSHSLFSLLTRNPQHC